MSPMRRTDLQTATKCGAGLRAGSQVGALTKFQQLADTGDA
jgi:hypothetical protein